MDQHIVDSYKPLLKDTLDLLCILVDILVVCRYSLASMSMLVFQQHLYIQHWVHMVMEHTHLWALEVVAEFRNTSRMDHQ